MASEENWKAGNIGMNSVIYQNDDSNGKSLFCEMEENEVMFTTFFSSDCYTTLVVAAPRSRYCMYPRHRRNAHAVEERATMRTTSVVRREIRSAINAGVVDTSPINVGQMFP